MHLMRGGFFSQRRKRLGKYLKYKKIFLIIEIIHPLSVGVCEKYR
jgi:hypothetical protein